MKKKPDPSPMLPGMHPRGISVPNPNPMLLSLLGCPICGYVGDLDGYDAIGADEDCVFCNRCGAEISL